MALRSSGERNPLNADIPLFDQISGMISKPQQLDLSNTACLEDAYPRDKVEKHLQMKTEKENLQIGPQKIEPMQDIPVLLLIHVKIFAVVYTARYCKDAYFNIY